MTNLSPPGRDPVLLAMKKAIRRTALTPDTPIATPNQFRSGRTTKGVTAPGLPTSIRRLS
jgi:hypothetical protein